MILGILNLGILGILKMFEMEFNISKMSSVISKALCLGLSEPTACLAAQTTPYALRNQLNNRYLLKVIVKNISVKETCKTPEI